MQEPIPYMCEPSPFLRSMTDVDFSLIHLQCVVNNNNDVVSDVAKRLVKVLGQYYFISCVLCSHFVRLLHSYTHKCTNMHDNFFYSGVSMTSSRFHFRFRLLLSFSLSFFVAAIFFIMVFS